MDKKWASAILLELNRKLLLLRSEEDPVRRMQIVDSILEVREGVPVWQQGEEKQLKVLLGLEE